VRCNCASFASETAESQLFGHCKGAFTGAHADRKGFFEAADGGTLFLDEVHHLLGGVQTKLLRVIENGEFIRMGETQVRTCNVRVIAATNKEITELIAEGKFAEDLYYRLNGFPISLPTLRERRSDIPMLARYLLAKIARGRALCFAPATLERLVAFDWPGNVRELDQVVRRAAAQLTDDELVILPEHLTFSAKVSKRGARDADLDYVRIAERPEREWVTDARNRRYQAHSSDLTAAAKELGRDRDTVAKSLGKAPRPSR
jgi:transcriptional regulator with GAF, ATPase, and Fis domain